ncbi:hypothetical protein KNT87_gp119 [Erwinia phage Cronus]|uniref:Uncharacterized protein n=1 Tax=Erwinia phage Cronus TaxID=2163633 RepID=A0A2S1GME1_9CAUD|nr:hypothetical protein KNT87_gp119 [Erwinia phage Cronus]AWD90558.1 hypothetical protein [Erwinia phage Cronus]
MVMLNTKWKISKESRVVLSSLIAFAIGILSLFFWWPIANEMINAPQSEKDLLGAAICIFSILPGPGLTGLISGLLFRSLIDRLEKLRFKRNILTNDTLEFVNSLRK